MRSVSSVNVRRTLSAACGAVTLAQLITEARRRAVIHRNYGFVDERPQDSIARDFKLNGLGPAVVVISDAYNAAWFGREFRSGGLLWPAVPR